ncbi:MAG: PilZ domain-containing protein [Spirochaetales bacterium]|nr:PilZ domain-containing protein [Spirochaetales bacterium]
MKESDEFRKRSHPRINVRIPAIIKELEGAGRTEKGLIINISREGLFLAVKEPFERGIAVEIRFSIPDNGTDVAVDGKIEYMMEENELRGFTTGLGISLNSKDIPEDIKIKLKDFFNSMHIYGWFC